MKTLSQTLKSYYKEELLYDEQYMPKPGDMNQCYYPTYKCTLDSTGLLTWLSKQELTETLLCDLLLLLKKKDTPLLLMLLSYCQLG